MDGQAIWEMPFEILGLLVDITHSISYTFACIELGEPNCWRSSDLGEALRGMIGHDAIDC